MKSISNTFMIMMIMISASLAGCVGEDVQPYKDQITELQTNETTNQNKIAQYEEDLEKLNNDLVLASGALLVSDTAKSLLEDEILDLTQAWELFNSTVEDNLDTEKAASMAEGYNMGVADTMIVSTLDTVMERGSLKCGIKTSQFGMGYSGTELSGMDIEYCKAIAAALGVTVQFVDAQSASTRFDYLAAGSYDVLIRTTSWTASRDSLDHGIDFTATNFYDGIGLLVKSDNYNPFDAGWSIAGLDGIDICLLTGTTTEGVIMDAFSSAGLSFTTVVSETSVDSRTKLQGGDCSAMAGDRSALTSHYYVMTGGNFGGYWIPDETLSKEPLTAAVRDYDSEWKDVVEWVWYGMIIAEEMGITSENYQSFDSNDLEVSRLLYSNHGLGTESNPLSETWMQDVLENVGNYGEIWDRSFCDGNYDGYSGSMAMNGCWLWRANSQNALVSEGGLMYAPPFR